MDIDYFNILVSFEVFAQLGNKDIHTSGSEIIVFSPYFVKVSERSKTLFCRLQNILSNIVSLGDSFSSSLCSGV